ncbi:MAG: PBP1A family penicillin-binding protein [Pseudomonadota bacterium]
MANQRSTTGPGLIGRTVKFVVGLIWGFTWRITAVAALITTAATGYFYSGLPSYDQLFDGRGIGSVTLRDSEDQIFAWRGEQYGGDLSVDDVSPHLLNAVIATEDKRYYDHFGIDPRGIARAMYANFKAGRLVQGGSTLTQQVAKNVFLDAQRKLERKIKEVPMALALELKYSKAEILSVYLNRVYLGAGTYGFEAAAQRYFGKSARILSPAEAAMLAGLLRAPSRLAPTRDLDRSQNRARVIIRLMREQGRLTTAEADTALENPAVLSKAAAARAGGAFADWMLEGGGEDGFLALLKGADVEIDTTFEPRLQKIAENTLAEIFANEVREGSEAEAAIVIMGYDGAVHAIVGGRKSAAAQFNRATQALRQPGSAFKPVVYAAALESGMSPLDMIEDAPITIGNWSPKNYGGRYVGPVTLRHALAKSINTVPVRLTQRVGEDRVNEMAQRLGLTTDIAPGPAVALGSSEVKLIELTGLYATIANGGRRVTPHGVDAIRLRGDTVPIDRGPEGPGEQVISPETAGLITNMLTYVVSEGTGRRAQLAGWQTAGKTGTTQKARDAWFIGYSADYVTGVWMGYDDNRPLTGVTGGGLPAEIWKRTMQRIHEGRTPRALNQIEPAPKAVAISPRPQPSQTQRDVVVEQVFRDVLRGLNVDESTEERMRERGGLRTGEDL